MSIKTDFANGGIEIEIADKVLSACLRDNKIEMDIGINYLGAEGFQNYAEIDLELIEAKALRDWLSDRILDLMLEQAASNSV